MLRYTLVKYDNRSRVFWSQYRYYCCCFLFDFFFCLAISFFLLFGHFCMIYIFRYSCITVYIQLFSFRTASVFNELIWVQFSSYRTTKVDGFCWSAYRPWADVRCEWTSDPRRERKVHMQRYLLLHGSKSQTDSRGRYIGFDRLGVWRWDVSEQVINRCQKRRRHSRG